MRHGKKFNHLGRTTPHRKAMLSNMASSLIMHKRITTTVAKAKALRKYVEPILTKAKEDTTHSRRVVFSYLNDKISVQTLFDDIAEKISTRPGGYTRIIKTGNRLGDNADMCIIELVDFNELLLAESKPAKAKSRRSRRGGSKSSAVKDEAKTEEAVVVEDTTTEEVEDKAVEAKAEEVESTEESTTEDSSEETKKEDNSEEAEK